VDETTADHLSRFALERLADGLYWMQEDGRVVYANAAASALMAYSVEELLGMKMYELNVDLDGSSWPAIWGLLKADGHRTFEARHRRKDGRVLQLEVSAHFFELEGKEYSCAFIRDIGERRELELRLRHAEKMEAVGRLAGGVAHDFNNQLGVIIGYAGLLRRAVRDNPKALSFVEELFAVARVATKLTAQLLAFSRRGKFLVEPVDLYALIGTVIPMIPLGLDKRIRVETELRAERAWVLGDPSQLQSVVLNLALNARDAMPHGGTLTFSTSNVHLDATQPAQLAQPAGDLPPGTYVTLSVRDTGTGMDPQTQARIFEPFFTTKELGAGTGLGLAAAYGAIKNHKGAIAVQSVPHQGSMFTIHLPVSRSGSAQRPATEEPESLRLHGHVMLVEDEPALRAVARQMLSALGCTVTAFEDAASALGFFRESHAGVDLIILDMVLPGMTGAEAFAALKEIDRGVQVLVVSGYSLDGQAQQLVDDGARGFLQKPFDMAGLAGKVGAILRR
jgi:two-component system, cell cycle sensor histidine kinase and response regulator CckA